MLAAFVVAGLVIGSFLNVVIARVPEHRSLWAPGSASDPRHPGQRWP